MQGVTMAIDGNNLARRMFHMGEANEEDRRKNWTVHEFYAYLIRLHRSYTPEQVIIGWDDPPYIRSEIFPGYKAKRPPIPPNWSTHLHLIKWVAQQANIVCYSKEGYEADDVLYTISQQQQNVLCVSSDRDLLALVSEVRGITMELLRWSKLEGPKRERFVTRQDVKNFFGVYPEHFPLYKGMAGDTSDNIPGVEGVGYKNAVDLIERFGSLQGIYDNLHMLRTKKGLPTAIAKKLHAGRGDLLMFMDLCRLKEIDEILPDGKPLDILAISETLQEIE